MTISKQAEEVWRLIRAERNGALCTLSKKMEGWPFGSITPYALTGSGDPLILISDIAEHTRNLKSDARASLLVQDSGALEDPQAGARATLIGYAMPVPEPLLEDASRRYLGLFPASNGYFAAHDFSLYQIKISDVRFIGGFGEIYWLKASGLIDESADRSSNPLAPHEAMICEHMNADHEEALAMYASAFSGIEGESARMIHIDPAGFDLVALRAGNHIHARINFERPVHTTEEVRAAMVRMVKLARESRA
ncbi:MAG TPA: DUF2470 domain-containing protein [Blastocatellia bacterium]|nr:DUF2470 domain-containing protein [Blastocatellia bacterium]